MSIEKARREDNGRMPPLKAALLGGLAVAAAAGAKAGYEKAEMNTHVLSPAAITQLQKESGATDTEVAAIEVRLRELIRQELLRLREPEGV